MNESIKWGIDDPKNKLDFNVNTKGEQLHLLDSIDPLKVFMSIDFSIYEKNDISSSILFKHHKGLKKFIESLNLDYSTDTVFTKHRQLVLFYNKEFRAKFSDSIEKGSDFDRDLDKYAREVVAVSNEESLAKTAPPPKKDVDRRFADKKNIQNSFIEQSLPRGDQDDDSNND